MTVYEYLRVEVAREETNLTVGILSNETIRKPRQESPNTSMQTPEVPEVTQPNPKPKVSSPHVLFYT